MLFIFKYFKISSNMKQIFCIFVTVLMTNILSAQIAADADDTAEKLGITSKVLPKPSPQFGTVDIFLQSTCRAFWEINGGVETAQGKPFIGKGVAQQYDNFCPTAGKGQVLVISITDKWNETISRKLYGFNSTLPDIFVFKDGYKLSVFLRELERSDKLEK
jgi:hypothetical protein